MGKSHLFDHNMEGLPCSVDAIVNEFVSLGGVLENLRIKKTSSGLGLFPVDISCRSRVFAPDNLLVDSHSFAVNSAEIVIAPELLIPCREKEFIEFYYNCMSWGGDSGSRSCMRFVKELLRMPDKTKQLLFRVGFDLSPCDCDDPLDVFHQSLSFFLGSRRISYLGRSVMAPFVELLNHSPHGSILQIANDESSFSGRNGIVVDSIGQSEACIVYDYDALSLFLRYGFVSSEMRVFSLAQSCRLPSGYSISVLGGKDISHPSDAKKKLEAFDREKKIVIPSLLLSYGGDQTICFEVFRSMLPDLDLIDVEAVWRGFYVRNNSFFKELKDSIADLPTSSFMSGFNQVISDSLV